MMTTFGFSIFVACTPSGGIGYKGQLPWVLQEDLQRFRRITTITKDPAKENVVIMGRKTYESLPIRPLERRRNIVLSRSGQDIRGVETYNTLDAALSVVMRDGSIEHAFVIGGQDLFDEALQRPECKHAYVTIVDMETPCDRVFPLSDIIAGNEWSLSDVEEGMRSRNGIGYGFYKFERIVQPKI